MTEQMHSLMLQLYRAGIGYSESVREFRRLFLITALEDNSCNQGETAKALGMHRNTLTRQCKDLGIDIKELRNGRRPPRAIVVRQAVRVANV